MNDKGRSAGFTLVELMITILIAAIVLIYGVPAFRNMILNNRQTARMNNILTSVMLARSEALKRHVSVSVCKSTDNRTCTSSGGWEQGWIVFVDPNENGVVDAAAVDPSEDLIRVFQGFANDASLRGSSGIRNSLSYRLTGFTALGGNEQFVYCDSRVQNFSNDSAYARILMVNPTGRAKIVAGNDPAVGSVNSCVSP